MNNQAQTVAGKIFCQHKMRLLLVCGLAVLATAELVRKAHFLNTVLGSKHTAQVRDQTSEPNLKSFVDG